MHRYRYRYRYRYRTDSQRIFDPDPDPDTDPDQERKPAPARRLGRFANPPWGAVGYLLQREAARRLLAQGDLVRAPADHWQLAMDAGLVIYGLEPQGIGTYRGEDPDFSTIPGRGAARRAAGLPTLEPGLVSSLHRLKQSLIRLFLRFRWPRP
jgi:hypothetical protein